MARMRIPLTAAVAAIVVLIHAAALPALYFALSGVVRTSHERLFIDHARTFARMLAEQLELEGPAPAPQRIRDVLDLAILNGDGVYAEYRRRPGQRAQPARARRAAHAGGAGFQLQRARRSRVLSEAADQRARPRRRTAGRFRRDPDRGEHQARPAPDAYDTRGVFRRFLADRGAARPAVLAADTRAAEHVESDRVGRLREAAAGREPGRRVAGSHRRPGSHAPHARRRQRAAALGNAREGARGVAPPRARERPAPPAASGDGRHARGRNRA